MTVDRDIAVSENFVGSGTTGPFAVTNFNIATVDQIEPGGVSKVVDATGVATILILNDPGADGYTAVISGNLVTINTVSAVASGYTLCVVRDTDRLQTVALPAIGRFRPIDVEEALDLLSMQIQELRSSQVLGSSEAAVPTDLLSVGWDGNSRDWTEIEVSVEIESILGMTLALQVSLDNGASQISTGYEWVASQSYGSGGAGTVDSYVSNSAADRAHWQLPGIVIPTTGIAGRIIGNFRISRLDLDAIRSTKIVGACTYTGLAGTFVYVGFGGTLDAQPSAINGVSVTDAIRAANIAAGSRIDVRGIR